jgi:glycogen phosphorylase
MQTIRPLPKPLERLGPLAFDLRLTGSKTLSQIWRRLDPEAWDRTNNPYIVLLHAHQERLEEAASDTGLLAQLDVWFARRKAAEPTKRWFDGIVDDGDLTSIAYLSMEFGLSEALPIYSGGLGILAGDHLKSASDLGVPVVGIGLLYQQGYFRQVLAPDGWQLEAYPFNDPGSLPVAPVLDADGRWPRIRLDLPGRTLLLRVWRAQVGSVSLYLLDSNHPLNSPWDRGITADLYAAGREKRLLQELVLGVGGWRLLDKLGIDAQVCHLNEGHAAFAVIARAAAFAERHRVTFAVALRATRAGNVFTTHTPVEAAFDRFDPDLVLRYARPLIREAGVTDRAFLALGRRDPDDDTEPFNMAYLAVHGSAHINGVARLHGAVSRRLFQPLVPAWPESEVPVGHVTNGVHIPTWASAAADRLWRGAYGTKRSWLQDIPRAAERVAGLPDDVIWSYRAEARASVVDYVRTRLRRQLSERDASEDALSRAAHTLDPNVLTLGFARRFAGYKRADLLLHDPDRFARILTDADRPVQIVVAGKAHPEDQAAKATVRRYVEFAARPDVAGRVVFLEDYDMVLAQHLASGTDVWINNPRRPAEACGTSGMKLLVNGGLHCSTMDGWWDEAYAPEVGWAIGGLDDHDGADGDPADAEALYVLLEDRIVPEFYDRGADGIPHLWVERIQASIGQLVGRFSSDRMVQEYVQGAYLPAARGYAVRAADGAQVATALEAWHDHIEDAWATLRFGRVEAKLAGDDWTIDAHVYLGDLELPAVQAQLFADGSAGPTVIPMHVERPIAGAVNGYVMRAVVPGDRPVWHYTPRVVPWHPSAVVPLESSRIAWGPSPIPVEGAGSDEALKDSDDAPVEAGVALA